ncbi:bifunctional phosphoribosylaminoimidazolecarboxamide formyltransferase/IMP cyclohydrolase [Pelagibacteraceae bacterium]|jgi:phosphoribosylaminoimidazolecarboxamide formyltransferase/IMP cyclohydrolase|nr:bifunctional phosphoribosylaminoimidazolecarboxamide formyltransferase/IMP cyclohydrolase [Pelagibacteraceae bacterium]
MQQKIKTALISVYDKTDLPEILKTLNKYKVKIISSGGTYKSIRQLGYACTDVSSYTGFKEMLDGRVKTLHPKIHAGILHDRSNKKHTEEMNKKKFPSIDLIIVNFYPFQKIIMSSKNKKKIIENIDIGGPTMVRAAAKNFKNVAIITNNNDYSYLINEIEKNKGKTSLKFREYMSSKAFGLTAYYDSMIADWFNRKLNIKFPERKTIFGKRFKNLRYGENPHQKSSIYISDYNDKELGLNQLNGKDLSYNNYNDIFASLEILTSLKDKPTTVIIKHANPCGVSSNKSPLFSFKSAYASDPISAFGGVIACNFKINKIIAKEINKNFLEVILAKGFDKEALKILNKKKNLRIIDISKYSQKNQTIVKTFENSFMIQDKDKSIFNKKDLKFVTKKKPTRQELKEIEFAFNISKYIKSNAIALTNNFSTIGIGAGQSSRIDSCKIAIQKAKSFHIKKIKSSIAASDAFFPFADGIKLLISAGIKIIVQPGGSIRDQEVIKAADKAKIKMIFTNTRHFKH